MGVEVNRTLPETFETLKEILAEGGFTLRSKYDDEDRHSICEIIKKKPERKVLFFEFESSPEIISEHVYIMEFGGENRIKISCNEENATMLEKFFLEHPNFLNIEIEVE